MKKIISIFVITILLCCFFDVYAESHDVVAKYSESQNIVTYNSSISNGVSTIKVDNGTFTLNTDSSDLNDVDVVIIKLSGEALDWLKTYTDSYDNYYFYFRKNESDVNITDKITINYSSFDKKEKQLVIFNSNGDMSSKGNGSVVSYKTNFYVSVTNAEKEAVSNNNLELDIDSNGKVMIDGTIYKRSANYSTENSKVKVAIIPNNGYEVADVILDGKDISDTLKSGFIVIDLKKTSKLSVGFSLIKTETIGKGYTISGKVIVDGEAVSDAVVILNDDVETVTNIDGEYKFDDVPVGLNSILIMKDGKGIGYAMFKIVSSDVNEFETYEDDVFTIEMGQNNLTFVMDLNVNDDYSIDFSNVKIDRNYNYMWLIILGAVLFIGVIIVFVVKKKHK